MTSDAIIVGRRRVAHALGRSPRTVSRWLRAGILPAEKRGPHLNNLLQCRAADLRRLRGELDPRDGGDR